MDHSVSPRSTTWVEGTAVFVLLNDTDPLVTSRHNVRSGAGGGGVQPGSGAALVSLAGDEPSVGLEEKAVSSPEVVWSVHEVPTSGEAGSAAGPAAARVAAAVNDGTVTGDDSTCGDAAGEEEAGAEAVGDVTVLSALGS